MRCERCQRRTHGTDWCPRDCDPSPISAWTRGVLTDLLTFSTFLAFWFVLLHVAY